MVAVSGAGGGAAGRQGDLGNKHKWSAGQQAGPCPLAGGVAR
jgi:hypothetical protein